MKSISTIILCLTILHTSHSQNHTIMPTTNWVHLKSVNSVSIEGYDGKEIIIESDYEDHEKVEEKSVGLKLWNNDEFDNATKIGLTINEKSDAVIIKQVVNNACGANDDQHYNIKIPKNMNIKYEHSTWEGEILHIKNISGTIEVSTNYNEIVLEEVTGPMAIKTVYGGITADFQEVSQTGSVSLYSVYEHVDVTVPTTTKSNVNLNTTYGNIYSDLDIDVDKQKSGKKGWTGSKVIGTVNNGGVDFILTATYANIYLRSN